MLHGIACVNFLHGSTGECRHKGATGEKPLHGVWPCPAQSHPCGRPAGDSEVEIIFIRIFGGMQVMTVAAGLL
jgi:hypothetical protein